MMWNPVVIIMLLCVVDKIGVSTGEVRGWKTRRILTEVAMLNRKTVFLAVLVCILACAAVSDAADKKKKGPKVTTKVYFDITIGGKEAGRFSTLRYFFSDERLGSQLFFHDAVWRGKRGCCSSPCMRIRSLSGGEQGVS